MTISTTDSKISYNGNGVTTDFAFPYPYLADADLQVLRVGTTGIVTTLALNTDYTVSNGTVSVNTAPGVGERLVINRVVEIVQETDYITGDPFPAETHERALDRLTMIAQQLAEEVGRSVKVSVTSTVDPDALLGSIAASEAAADASAQAADASAQAADASAQAAAGSAASINLPLAFSSIQDIATARLLGRATAGTGDVEELTAIPSGVDVPAVRLSGTIDVARLGSGTADSTTFLRGDQTWQPAGGAINFQYFTASGTFTVPAGVTQVLVTVVGGGGAGGGRNTSFQAGGGGGGGGYAKGIVSVTPGSNVTVTVGAGGTGVSAGTGGAGGTSSFGASISATGGGGGTIAGTPTGGAGGAGTAPAGGISISGAPGTSTLTVGESAAGGAGGGPANSFASAYAQTNNNNFLGGRNTITGGRGGDAQLNGNGNAATGLGCGGGGAFPVAGVNGPGGNGLGGFVIVEW